MKSTKEKEKEILERVNIPRYFKDFIEPELGSYYSVYKPDFRFKPTACCPLHDEDTPSFRYYENTESFYCFGCQKGGTVINLHKYFFERTNGHEITKEQAIDSLYRYYIENKDSESILADTVVNKIKPERKETSLEKAKVIEYLNSINKRLICEDEMEFDEKKQYYDKIDVIREMIDLEEEVSIKEVKAFIGV